MKKMLKRTLAFVIILSLCLSFVPAQYAVQAAAVDYVYAGNYIKNWGTRGEVATYLSQNAESFYATNNTSYALLANLSGSSTTSDVPSSALYLKLHQLMYDNVDDYTTYDETRELYQYTDCQNSGKTSDKISSFYSGEGIGPAWDSGKTWNREHTWPNSKSDGGSGSNTRRETDIMMLRPASVSENSSRGNKAYGEGDSYYHPNAENNGAYDLRGDVARIVLYVYTCWGGSSNYHDGALDYMWGSGGVIESKEVLLAWMESDPVDTWELGRNDSVESITGTRNVFVDYPELAFCLFNEEVPAGYQSPSGNAVGYTVTAESNNTAWGTVSVTGNTVIATPKTGYEVAGYTILSGTAQITRNGNTFTVVPGSDVKVRINFSARTQRTVSFSQFGVTVDTLTAYGGDAVTLPNHYGQVQDGYSFVGWVDAAVTKTQTKPTFYQAGRQYVLAENVVLRALYSVTESGTGSSDTFALHKGELTEGDYLIVYNGAAMNTTVTSKRLQYSEVTIADEKVQSPSADTIWKLAFDGTYWTIFNEAAGKYAGGTGVKNNAGMLASATEYAKWTSTEKTDNTYEFTNLGNSNKSVNANLRRNGTYGFACYSTSTGGALSLYKREDGGITWYLTDGEQLEDPVAIDALGNTYGTLEKAMQNVAAEGKLTLLQNVSENVTVSKNMTIDLNGFLLDGTVSVADGCVFYGMDSQTDDYTVKDENGYGKITKVTCQGTGKAAGLGEGSLDGSSYLMVSETDGVSFHSVKLQLTTVSLRATQAGIYYKSSFAGDELVSEHIENFGVALSIVAVPTAQTIGVNCGYSVFRGFSAGSSFAANSTLLKGIMKTANTQERNQTNANTSVYGRAYMLTKDKRYIFGEPKEYALRQITEKVDALWTQLSESQQETLQQMYTEFEDVMALWTIPNIKGSMGTEPDQARYVKVTAEGQLTNGSYVMLLDAGYAPGVLDNSWLSAVQLVAVDGVITEPESGIWTLTFDRGSVSLTDANGTTVAPSGGNTNGIKAGSYQWAWSFEDGKVTFAGVGSDTVFLAANKGSAYKFRGYKQSTATGQPTSYPYQFTLYKLIEE